MSRKCALRGLESREMNADAAKMLVQPMPSCSYGLQP